MKREGESIQNFIQIKGVQEERKERERNPSFSSNIVKEIQIQNFKIPPYKNKISLKF